MLKYKALTRNKTKNLNVKLNEKLYEEFASTIKEDENYSSITDFIEEHILKYLKRRRKI